MGRLLGIDYGKARIGLSLSDPHRFLASPLKVLLTKKTLKETAEALVCEFTLHGPLEAVIIGLPLFLNGTDSPLSLEVKKMQEILLSLTSFPIILWDERLTTVQVERVLKEANINRKKRAALVDTMAATAILQNYLDRIR